MKTISDRELAAILRSGDRDMAITVLYRQFRDDFFGFIRKKWGRLSTDEVSMLFTDTCLSVFDNVASGRYELRPEACFETYLFEVGKRKMLKLWRDETLPDKKDKTSRVARFMPFSDYFSGQSRKDKFLNSADDDDDRYWTETQYDILRELVFQELEEPCGSILRYVYYEAKSGTEIAEKMSYSGADVVKTQKYRCMKKLTAAFKERLKKEVL